MRALEVRAARSTEAAAIRELLGGCDLPIDGAPEESESFFVAVDGARIVGSAGLELHGGDGLLRSLAVAPEFRGGALAVRLCDAVVHRARELGVRRLFLLTEAAERYFAARGWRRIDRAAAPKGIAASREFAAVCPAAAALMEREL